MNVIEKTVWQILLNKVYLNDTLIDVLVNSPPLEDNTPCITLKSSNLGVKSKRYVDTFFYPVKPEHSLYDANNPNTKYPFEVQVQKESIEVQISIWCNTEEERFELLSQVETILNEVQNFNYKYCLNFDVETNNCKTLNNECAALTSKNGRANKKQCPKPDEYNYENILTNNFIIPNTIQLESSFNMDELNDDPITLHSIFKLNMIYYKTYFIGGNPNTDIQIK